MKWEYQTILPQFSHSVMSDSSQPHGLQHARLPCPAPTHGVYSNSCQLNQWCHPTISPLASPSPPVFSLFQHQGLFQWVSSWHQVTKDLDLQLQPQSFHWIFRLISFRFTGLISLLPKGLSRVFSNTTVQNINSLVLNLFIVQLSH